jgi:hypothetical protein
MFYKVDLNLSINILKVVFLWGKEVAKIKNLFDRNIPFGAKYHI